MANLIRVKQLDQPDLSGFFNDAFINTGIFDATFVDKFTDQNISGIKTFIDGVNLNNIDNLSLSGVDITITSGNVILTNRPTVNGSGVLLIGEAPNPTIVVYTTGNQNISGTKNFYTRPTVNGTGLLLSGEIPTLPATIVYTTGDQTISGVKTFTNNINISGTGSFQGINILNLNELILSGAKITILGDSGVHSSTNIYISGNPLITGNLSLYSTVTNLANTGSTLLNSINSLSGTLTGNYGTIINLASTGSNLVGIINSLSGTLTGNYGTIINLANTGSTLLNRINSLSGTLTGNYGTIINLASTGNTLTSRINSLSGSSVLTYGDQTISGVKTFTTGVNISGNVRIGIDNNDKFDLYVRKSPAGVTVPNPDSGSIAVFEGSGNSHITILASNAQSAGVVLGSPADIFGAYLNWNHDNNALRLATAKTNGFIQILTNNEAEAVRITSPGNVGIGTTSPSEKLQVVGNILANNLVYNTGNQTISGVKTFATIPTVNGTGVALSGSIPFIITFGHRRNNSATGPQHYYFGPAMDLDPVALSNNEKRRVQISEKCFLRKITWSSIATTTAPIPSNAMTGYFKNFGNDALGNNNNAGVQITSEINIPAANTIYNTSTGDLNIPIASGDYVSFYYQTNHSTNAVNLVSHVTAYFYV